VPLDVLPDQPRHVNMASYNRLSECRGPVHTELIRRKEQRLHTLDMPTKSCFDKRYIWSGVVKNHIGHVCLRVDATREQENHRVHMVLLSGAKKNDLYGGNISGSTTARGEFGQSGGSTESAQTASLQY